MVANAVVKQCYSSNYVYSYVGNKNEATFHILVFYGTRAQLGV